MLRFDGSMSVKKASEVGYFMFLDATQPGKWNPNLSLKPAGRDPRNLSQKDSS